MRLRHLIIMGMLAGFAPAVLPCIDKTEAATTTTKKKKKTVQNTQPRVKQNFRGPRPGEPNAGWTDDCLRYYDIYGKLPAYCGKYGHGFGMWN